MACWLSFYFSVALHQMICNIFAFLHLVSMFFVLINFYNFTPCKDALDSSKFNHLQKAFICMGTYHLHSLQRPARSRGLDNIFYPTPRIEIPLWIGFLIVGMSHTHSLIPKHSHALKNTHRLYWRMKMGCRKKRFYFGKSPKLVNPPTHRIDLGLAPPSIS